MYLKPSACPNSLLSKIDLIEDKEGKPSYTSLRWNLMHFRTGFLPVENRLNKDIKGSLIDAVGKDGFTDSLIDLVSYSYDASDHRHRPEAAVWPRTTEQVSKVCSIANAHGFPVVPRGAGTGLAGGAVPVRGGIVLDLCRMKEIIRISITDRTCMLQPGVVYDDLQAALSPYGFFFPPDPASGSVCTIGGNVATNAGGIRGAKYGVTRDYVMGLKVVLPDGRILRTGSRCLKSLAKYDLTSLFVGSEGTLGIITEIALKIRPRPPACMTAQAFFSTLADAADSVKDVISSGIIPSVLEILDENTLNTLREETDLDIPEASAMILVETDGYTETETAFQMKIIKGVFGKNRAKQVKTASSQEEAETLWRARRWAGSVAAKMGSGNLSEDVTVPISMVSELMTGISSILGKLSLPFVVFGHAGDGNLHPKIMYDRHDQEQTEQACRAAEEIFCLALSLGGTLTGEHGIGLAKAPFMPLEHSGSYLDMMRGIKRLLDPSGILNPGKMNL